MNYGSLRLIMTERVRGARKPRSKTRITKTKERVEKILTMKKKKKREEQFIFT